MWVFLNNAFLSIVQDKNNMARLMVRARLRGDIERAFPNAEVIETPPPADYRFRASIPRVVVSANMQKAVLDIDYTNFKKSVPDQRRHDTYLRVWGVMADAQDRENPVARGYSMFPAVGDGLDPDPFVHVADIPPPEKAPVSRRGKKARPPRSTRR